MCTYAFFRIINAMATLKCLTDPLGHTIMISKINGQCNSPEKLITSPAFIIQLGSEQLYYFRIIDWEMNMLIANKTDLKVFVAESCIQKPASDYITQLLNNGGKVISNP